MSLLIRRATSLWTVLLLAAGAAAVAVPPATAASTTLCRTYAACAKAGMGHDGYSKAGSAMYWQMYAGHNCTNYVAYRLVRSGLPNKRPWTGSGNASAWGTHLAAKTDDKPAVGAVAWWEANVPGAGSSGHVAYVEQVVSPDEIVVSQDSWGGEFTWARITRGRGWPSGFIHLNDVPLTNTAQPTVAGDAKVGATLSAHAGSWRPGTVSTTYQWRADGKTIPGANQPTLTLAESHLGKQVAVAVTASQLGYPRKVVVSAATPEVLRGQLTALTQPRLAGSPVVDGVLRLTPGRWDPQPDQVTHQWLADGEPLPGRTGPTLTVGPALVGRTLTVRETAGRAGFDEVSVTTGASGSVRPGVLEVRAKPTLSGHPRLSQPLTVATGSTRQRATAEVQWVRDGVLIPQATGRSYRPTRVDLGSRLSARVTWKRAGYLPAPVSSPRTVTVRATPQITVRAQARGAGRVTVTVAAKAEGSSPVASFVRVRAGGRQLASTKLKNGAASVALTGLPRGSRSFVVQLPGSSRVLAATVTAKVHVR